MDVDIAIIGQGIAGSTLALELLRRNISFVVIDKGVNESASIVSSGLINPITGRNFVKSWMIDDLLPASIVTYQSFEALLGNSYIGKNEIIRSLDTIEQENQWHLRLADEGYNTYISSDYSGPDYGKWFSHTCSFGHVCQSYNLDTAALLTDFRTYLRDHDRLIASTVDYDQWNIGNDFINVGSVKAKRVICSEGWGVKNNPYFNQLPFRPAKGEVLVCQIDSLPTDYILKYHKFLVPLNNQGLFWVGSNYNWDFNDSSPTETGKQDLLSYLNKYLKVDFEIVDHLAGVRPATKYRRPFVGRHQQHDNLYIFNGLGTKGISLAPYWSRKLINHIVDGTPCDVPGVKL